MEGNEIKTHWAQEKKMQGKEETHQKSRLQGPKGIQIYLFIFHFSFIIHMCIQGLVHFSPLPPPPPLPPTPPPPSPPREYRFKHKFNHGN
jgi:hypothetical protein